MKYKQLLNIDTEAEQIMQELPAMIFEITGIDINSLINDLEIPAD